MERKIVVNGKEYPAKPITFNTICQFEDMGVPMAEIDQKSVSLIRAYAAVFMGKKADKAGEEIEQHVMNGGTFEDIADALNHAIEESGFFQALSKKAETKDREQAET